MVKAPQAKPFQSANRNRFFGRLRLLKRSSQSLKITGREIISRPLRPSESNAASVRNQLASIINVRAIVATCEPNISMNRVAPNT